jgi:hypothetical protein
MVGWQNATVLNGGGVLQYAFTLDAAALAQLNGTALAERYVPATLAVSGEEIGPVGLRVKGEGAMDPCFQGGMQICPKVSFRVKFDQVQPGKRFQGLQRLNFHAMADDASLMRERLNAKLFADSGIHTPRVTHGEITINDENKGIFAVVEEVDLAFVQDRFKPGGTGNLYKEAWPEDIDPEGYDVALQTNQTLRDNSAMAAFAQALRSSGPQELAGVVNHFADVDYLIRYLAVDRAISNYNGVSAFYCDAVGHECSNSNFYWYQSEGPKFWLIPWDLASSLSLHTPLEAVPEWDSPPGDCTLRYRIEGAVVMPPACDPVFSALRGVGRPAWVNGLNKVLNVWDMGALYRQIDVWTDEIAGAVARDRGLPGGSIAWRTAVRALKRDLAALRERVEKIRDGMTATPFGLAAPGVTDFEGTTALPFLLSTSSESNLRSGVFHDLNRRGALGGNVDVRLEFELRNETGDATGAFSQWALMRLPLQKTTSLTGLKSIRLRIIADNIRTVRVELDSPAYGDEAAEHYGWSVLAGQLVDSPVLELSKLALPDGSRGPNLGQILSSVAGLTITPEARGRSEAGFFPAGKVDVGFVQIDDIAIELQ